MEVLQEFTVEPIQQEDIKENQVFTLERIQEEDIRENQANTPVFSSLDLVWNPEGDETALGEFYANLKEILRKVSLDEMILLHALTLLHPKLPAHVRDIFSNQTWTGAELRIADYEIEILATAFEFINQQNKEENHCEAEEAEGEEDKYGLGNFKDELEGEELEPEPGWASPEYDEADADFPPRKRLKRNNQSLKKIKGQRRYYCDECDYSISTNFHLEQHKDTKHRGIRFSCDDCDYSGLTKQNLKVHIESKHKGIRYPCDECEYSGARKMNLKIHKKTTHDGTLFACDRCTFTFTTKKGLELHFEGKHEGREYICDQCSFKTNRMQYLRKHMQRKHEDLDCKKCEFVAAPSIPDLLEHYKDKHPEAPPDLYKYKCDLFECEYSTNVETNFKAHLSAQHKQGEQCEQCDFVAASKTKLEQHRDLHGSFPCDECNHVATLQKDIKMHKFTFHTIRPHACDICEYTTSSRAALKNHHQRLHEPDTTYPCDKCTYEAGAKEDLAMHIQRVHDKVRAKCDLCEYSSSKNQYVKLHKQKQHREQYEAEEAARMEKRQQQAVRKLSSRIHACGKCDYADTDKNSLLVHLNQYHDVTTYPCDKCNYVSKVKNDLIRHIQRIHEGKRHYCDQCEYSAQKSTKVKLHKQRVHKELNIVTEASNITQKTIIKTI